MKIATKIKLLTMAFALVCTTCNTVFANEENGIVLPEFPPKPESQVTFKNYRQKGKSDWAYNNINAIYNSVVIPRGKHQQQLVSSSVLSQADKNTLINTFKNNQSDSLIILQDGKIIFESYWGYADSSRHHIWFSMTKSLVSLAFGMLVDQGKISLNESPATYIPELKGTGFERVTIQNLLNHSTGINFKENYTDPNSPFLKYYAPALNMVYIPGGRDVQPQDTSIYGVYDFLTQYIKPDSAIKPGEVFDYNSTNADVLGWLISRVSQMPLNDFISQHIWKKLGVEHDAFIGVDRAYMPIATGGMATTLRDLSKLGQMILQDGKFNSEQIVTKSWLDQITSISDKEERKMAANTKYKDVGWQAYKNMWWVLDSAKGEFAASGIHGQQLYINKSKNVVAAYFSHHEIASNVVSERSKDKLSTIRNIVNKL